MTAHASFRRGARFFEWKRGQSNGVVGRQGGREIL